MWSLGFWRATHRSFCAKSMQVSSDQMLCSTLPRTTILSTPFNLLACFKPDSTARHQFSMIAFRVTSADHSPCGTWVRTQHLLRKENKEEKAQHPMGFEPMTSGWWACALTTVLQPLPSEVVNANAITFYITIEPHSWKGFSKIIWQCLFSCWW